jgi:hypothetical protein
MRKSLFSAQKSEKYGHKKMLQNESLCISGSQFLGFLGFSICLIKIETAKRILRSNYKRRFSIFLVLPMRNWLFGAQKSEKAAK